MADENRCPQCGALHAEGARPGLCLRCLLLNALENQTALPADETQTASLPGSRTRASRSKAPSQTPA